MNPAPPNEDPASILLVDDREANLLALEAVLAPSGARLVRARSGPQALQCMLDEDFAVVLLDVHMPGMDGFETAELVRARDRSKDTPILFLTAMDRSDRQAARGYALGAVDYVFKPIAPEILGAKVAVFVELFRRGRREARARAELARSNRDLLEYAHVVAHDLQAPLRSVTGHLAALERSLGARPGDGAHPSLDAAVAAATRMRVQIRDLLAYARITERAGVATTTSADGALDRAIANLGTAVDDAGARIVRGPLPEVRADPTEVMQLFQNLLDNALKFRRDAAPEIVVRSRPVDGFAEFTVEDNGIGVETGTDPERIFGVFQRLHTREEFPGNGIGLAICRRIVENHGGRIWVRPRGDARPGAAFHFTLLPAP